MQVLVTGGAGFIGANFLHEAVLARPDDRFINVDCLTYAANLRSLEGVADRANYCFERVDITDPTAVSDLFKRTEPDLVVHFAAESHVDRSILGPAAFIQTNVVGTFNLLEATRAAHQERRIAFHHVSTDEVYGSLGGDGFFTETTAYDPSSPYSASKAASDHLVRAYHRTYGLPVTITNCSNNYGPYQFPEKLVPLVIGNAVARAPLPVYGTGNNVRDWLYVTDHCAAIWSVIERGAVGETYNVGGNNEVENLALVRQLCRIVAEELGEPVRELLELITFVEDRPGHDFRYAIDSRKLQRECGWRPKETLETGLRKTVRWYLENSSWVESVTSGSYQSWIAENYGTRVSA